MVGIILSSDELQTIFDILGLNENQSLVYFSLLSVGTLTIGQISQLTGLNYFQVQDALEVLIGSEYVDWTPGKISRYFAQEPFLKTYLLSYDPLTLLSIRDKTKNTLSAITETFHVKIQTLLSKLSEKELSVLLETYDEIKTCVKEQQGQIDKEISALTYSIKEMKRRLDIIFQLSRKLDASLVKDAESLTTELLFGETTFVLLLRDMVSRTKITLNILMPHPEVQTLTAASKLPPSVCSRTLIVGDFSKVPKSILKKVIKSGVRLKQASVDYWGCIRDNEEVLIGPLPQSSQQKEIVGIVSTNSTMVQFFSQQIGTYTTKGVDLREID